MKYKLNGMLCNIYILTVQYTECQQEKTLISILLLGSGQTAAAFFSAGERKQTSFPEDRVQRNSLPDFFINSGYKLSSVCTEDARHHADTLYLFICSLIMQREIIETPEFTIWKRLSPLDWWIHVCRSLPRPPAFPVKCCTVMTLLGDHCCKIHWVTGSPLKDEEIWLTAKEF